jgi:ribosomal protein L11 methyltransferase
MDIYYEITIRSTDEILLALLTAFDFESFEEREDCIIGYMNEHSFNEAVWEEIKEVAAPFAQDIALQKVMPQNWNEIWEASFQPVIVDDFCVVRADFHPKMEGIMFDLLIQPKMAFGTGHHATTYMMMASMRALDFRRKRVFDFGCGTGILAVLASKMGAGEVIAIDIEQESYLNTLENALKNDVHNIQALCSDLTDLPTGEPFDIVLANINRNILLKYSSELTNLVNHDGYLLWSGVLSEDCQQVIEVFEESGFSLEQLLQKDGWSCGKMKKTGIST